MKSENTPPETPRAKAAIPSLPLRCAQGAASIDHLSRLTKGEAWSLREVSPVAAGLLSDAHELLEQAVRELLRMPK